MPSLILELTDKTDARRKDEAEDWLKKLASRFEIEKRKYVNIEVIFRQLVMHEKLATGFANENDEPFPLNKNLKENIEQHLTKVRSKNHYGFHRFSFEKKDRIKSAEQTIRNQYADIDKIKELSASLRLSGSSSSNPTDSARVLLSNFLNAVPVNIQDSVPLDFHDRVPGNIHHVVPRHG
jgi:hypothetical protein